MTTLVECDKQGLITTVVSVPAALRDKYPGFIEAASDVGVLTHYYKDGVCLSKGKKPSEAHVFDPILGEWVLDSGLAGGTARAERERLLVASDWTQLPDVPLATKEAWATYRQALRDITDQPGFPTEIDWPAAP